MEGSNKIFQANNPFLCAEIIRSTKQHKSLTKNAHENHVAAVTHSAPIPTHTQNYFELELHELYDEHRHHFSLRNNFITLNIQTNDYIYERSLPDTTPMINKNPCSIQCGRLISFVDSIDKMILTLANLKEKSLFDGIN